MSYAGAEKFNPYNEAFKQVEAERNKRNVIMQAYFREKELRAIHPSLQNAWEKYQIVLKLVNTEINNEQQ